MMTLKGFSWLAGAPLVLALAACTHDSPDPNTPASDTMQSDDGVRIGPTPTNDVTTPGNPDSTGDVGSGDYPVVPPPLATPAKPPPGEQDLTPSPAPPR
jgi:hypothetical protein